jgi:hypothetical protein
VAHVGHELLADPLELPEAGQVVEDEDRAVASPPASRSASALTCRNRGAHRVDPQLVAEHLELPVEAGDHRGDLVVAGGLEDRLAGGGRLEAEERRGGPVGQPDPPGGVDDDQALDHPVEQGRRPLGLLPELGLPPQALLGKLAPVPLRLRPP